MSTVWRQLALLETFLLVLTAGCSQANQNPVTEPMIGHWEGAARIVVVWCHQKSLPVKLDIHADGTVTGTVGDATLAQGRMLRNRGWLGRHLNLATDYIVVGRLQGAIVAPEGITRSEAKIPLNFTDGAFTGGVNTSGTICWSRAQWKEKMVLSAGYMKLTQKAAKR